MFLCSSADIDLKSELCFKHKQFRLDMFKLTLQTFSLKHVKKEERWVQQNKIPIKAALLIRI